MPRRKPQFKYIWYSRGGNPKARFLTKFIKDKVFSKRLFLRDYKELDIPLKQEVFAANSGVAPNYFLIVDFNIPEDFEALDETYEKGLSDKRFYFDGDAFFKVIALDQKFRKYKRMYDRRGIFTYFFNWIFKPQDDIA